MRKRFIPLALAALVAGSTMPATAQTVSAMRWQRRIVLVAMPGPQDAKGVEQHRLLGGWNRQAADRDISLVEISGSHVTGAADDAMVLRKRYDLPPDVFQVVLIGKDGHVALRSREPVPADTLQGAIDAMPMRQAGGR